MTPNLVLLVLHGAQPGARLVEHVTTVQFRRVFAVLLVALAASLWINR